MATESILKTCAESLKRVQTFKPATLSREDDLGKQMSFADAVKPVEAIIALYKRIPLSALDDFTDGQLNSIQAQSNADFSYFKQILDFDATASGAASTRTNLFRPTPRSARPAIRAGLAVRGVWRSTGYRHKPP